MYHVSTYPASILIGVMYLIAIDSTRGKAYLQVGRMSSILLFAKAKLVTIMQIWFNLRFKLLFIFQYSSRAHVMMVCVRKKIQDHEWLVSQLGVVVVVVVGRKKSLHECYDICKNIWVQKRCAISAYLIKKGSECRLMSSWVADSWLEDSGINFVISTVAQQWRYQIEIFFITWTDLPLFLSPHMNSKSSYTPIVPAPQ